MRCKKCGEPDPNREETKRNRGMCSRCLHQIAALKSYHKRNTVDHQNKRSAEYQASRGRACKDGGTHTEEMLPDGKLRCLICGRVRA